MPDTVQAADTGSPASNINDSIYDVNNLAILLEIASRSLSDMNFGPPNARNHELEIVDTMVRLAEDQTAKILNSLRDAFAAFHASRLAAKGRA